MIEAALAKTRERWPDQRVNRQAGVPASTLESKIRQLE